ncbi:MAG TPA: branched-chain amino acid ABC transporter substrate-binding protein [Aggregatilineales bacterium]|nr:branched-chain amino acid ABC transporter substrate-binding protein [Aggregatilineales bacterium]
MKVSKLFAIALVVALLGMGFAAAPAAAQDAKVIKIASHSPLSGGQALLGTAIRNGVELAVEQLKQPLIDAGFTVEFVPFDDQATPDVGVSNAQNIVNDPAILALVGHLNSGVAIPSSEVYNRADLAMVSPANTNVKVTDRGYPTVNRVCGRDDAQGAAGAQYALETLNAKTVYVVHDKTAYGEGVATFFRDAMLAGGAEVLGFEGTTETSNFDAIITPIESANPDLIYFGGIYNQAAVFFKQARDKGVESQFMGPDGMDGSDLTKIAGEAVVGLVYTSAAGPASIYPAAAQFIVDYEAKFGIKPEAYAAEGYASAQIVMAALTQLISENGGALPTRADVAKAVRATADFETIIGKISFDANGDPKVATYYILSVKDADPAKWGENELISSVTAPSPLTAAEMMEMTPEPTKSN